MPQEQVRVVEKHYIEVNASARKKFFMGLMQGLGWGIGVTLGTAAFIVLIGYLASRINWVPIIGQYVQTVVNSTQQAPSKK
ncbi:MAG: hypothetical protein UU23_C0001G0089 [Candidatus Curtissbacteria bacterium GW2011_GWA1_40_9]|uniref:Uncharacterized protein n=1 Tax=Candidatus Curtissbacteria bacterium GW2011_GWA1_40_9 TaxID=1618408 RepID=A0A0G0W207_9BACT|nr:MAG: hypothetical protein UU23_C0001G0089 [Candidatus Curtissbacteria bacterium GW2011_GWA1_40_9]